MDDPHRSEAAPGLGRWFLRGSWAVLDQGLFSISNFALQVMLVRWLDARTYGAFAVAFSWFLLVGNVHAALLTEPALILAPGRYADAQPTYFRALMRLNAESLVVIVLGMLCVPVVMWCLGERELAQVFVGFAVVSPMILSVWLTRRLCYAVFRPRAAAIGGVAYLAVIVVGIYSCYVAGFASLWTVYGALALASLCGGSLTIRAIPIDRTPLAPDTIQAVRAAHWSYGRWLLASSPLRWAPSNLVYILLPLLPGPAHGLEASGTLRAAMNLVMPLLQAYTALATLLLPTFSSRKRAEINPRTAWFAAIFVSAGVVYWLGLVVFGDAVMRIVYGADFHAEHTILWSLGALPMLTGLVGVLQGRVMADERPHEVFVAYLVATVIAATLGSALCIWRGIEGAALGTLASYGSLAAMFGWLTWRARRAIASR